MIIKQECSGVVYILCEPEPKEQRRAYKVAR